ncbi:arginase [Alternaria panax]|uniref:Arginase n=1 Tax=Alternaria panax TaxID=48097 RepID=A0AAD4I627_9PLEO|nr:arginase [Alternaria panax]
MYNYILNAYVTARTLNMPSTFLTIIFSPYHVGLGDHSVGNGPNRIPALGLVSCLESLGIKVHIDEIPPVDNFEGEIGRAFEVLRQTSVVDLNFIYFGAHDDMDTPDRNQNGYFDAMGLNMLVGKSWRWRTAQIPGFTLIEYEGKLLYVGLRDLNEVQRKTIKDAGADVIWGDAEKKLDWVGGLQKRLDGRNLSPSRVRLDLDVLDNSVGVTNGFESEGKLLEEDVVSCMSLLQKKATPLSFTMCSFNLNFGDGDKTAGNGIWAAVAFVESFVAEKVSVAQS